jgi:hypothetical protein
LVKVIGLSSPTGTNDERQKAPLLVSSERTGTKGFSSETKKAPWLLPAPAATHAPSLLHLHPANNDRQEHEHRKNRNKKFNSISIPYHSSSHHNHHNDKSFNFTTSINITN